MKPFKLWAIATLLILLSGILLSATAFASNGDDDPNTVVMVSEPFEPVQSVAVRDLERTIFDRTLNREEINPLRNPGLFKSDMGLSGTFSQKRDRLAAKGLNSKSTPDILFNFEGLGTDGYTPPDTVGEVGPNHYVQMVNVSFAIFDKTGNVVVADTPFTDLFTGSGLTACENENDGDPIVVYDEIADRWLLSQFAVSSGTRMCIAISQTADPTGAYYLYQFEMPDFPDYFKFGVWQDAYYMGTNTGYPNGYYAYAFDRASMLNGSPATFQYANGYPNFLLPADLDGGATNPPPAGSPGYFYTMLSDGYPDHPVGVDRLALYEFDVDWTTPANSTFGLAQEIPIAEYNYTVCGFFVSDCIPQPGTSQGLDSLSYWPMWRFAYRNLGSYEAMVGNFTVDLDGSDKAAIRWFELQKTGTNWTLHQEGTYAPDSDHRWMGSIAMDGSGNIALGYSVSSSTTLPAIRYTVHEVGDPLGSMQAEKQIIQSAGVHTGIHRWGDYSSMNVDPVDNCTFWYTNQYDTADNAGFDWHTRVGIFKIPSCTGSLGDMGTLSGQVRNASNSNAITGALVTAEGITSTVQTATDSLGYYTSTLFVGGYNVTAEAYGFLPFKVSNVEIFSDSTTTQDFALAPASEYTVDGTVTDVNTGWPLYAHLSISGDPFDPPVTDVWTDPVSGYYQIDLAEGITYTFDVEAWVPGYLPASADVGPLTGDITQDFALDVDASVCSAPGYTQVTAPLLSESFDSGIPGSWVVIDNSGGTGCPWVDTDPGSRGNLTGGSGAFTIADSDECGIGTVSDTDLDSPAIDASSYSALQISYANDFNDLGSIAQVQVWDDSAWVTVEDMSGTDYRGPETRIINTTAGAGYSNTSVRFHYEAGWDWWWEVDDVVVYGTNCVPSPGGLVVGNVYDDNYLEALNGAIIRNEDGYLVEAMATPLDDSIEDGFFSFFSPSGSKTFTATMYGGYAADVETVIVVDSDTVKQDFYLPAGVLEVNPTSLAVTLDLGTSSSESLTLTNVGTSEAGFEIQERDEGFNPLLAIQGLIPINSEPAAIGPQSVRSAEGRENLHGKFNVPDAWTAGASMPAGEGVARYGKAQCHSESFYILGGVDESFSVTSNAWRYDTNTDTWNALAALPNPQEGPTAVCYQGYIYVLDGGGTNGFSIYDITADSWTTGPAFPRNVWGAAAGSYDGEIFFIGGDSDFNFDGTSAQVDIYNIATGTWRTGTSMPTAAVTALNVQAGQYVYVVGGWGDSTPASNVNATQRYDMSSDTWDLGPDFSSARADGSLAITEGYLYAIGGDADGGGTFNATATIETLDWKAWPGGAWTDISDPLPVAVTANNGGFCTESMAGGEVWNVAGYNGAAILNNANYRASERCVTGADVPWLSEDPITGTLSTASNVVIDVTFDASVPEIDQPGDYYAVMNITNDTPYGKLSLPVTMTVESPNTWGKIEGTITGLGYCDAAPIPLEYAEVIIEDSGGMTYTLMTDSNGYFSRWYDENLSTFDINVTYPSYQSGSIAGVSVIAGITTTVDFDLRLLEPCVSVNPGSLEVTLIEGYSEIVSLDLINTGAFPTNFELVEKDGGYSPSMLFNLGELVPQIEVRERLADYDENAISTANIMTGGGTPVMGVLAAGDVLNQWATGQTLSWGNGFDLSKKTVWINDNVGGGGSGLNEEFFVGGSLTGASFTPGFGGNWPGDMAYNLNTGMFWQVNVGGDNCIHEWDPAIPAATGNNICGATWTATSQRGLAWDPTDDSFFIGGWNEFVLYHVASDGSIIEQWNTSLPISGLAYNWEDGQLFIIENSSTDTISQFDVSSGTIVNTFTVTGFGNFAGAGLAIDCDGNLWAANQVDNNAYLIDSGVPGDLCFSDIPWLSTDPITGTLATDSTQTIDVTINTMTYTVGTYTGTLRVKTEDPTDDKIDVPVTMHIEAIRYGVDLVAENDNLSGELGSVVTYSVWMTNTGNLADGYNISAGSHNWDMDMPASMDPMAPGDSHAMEVSITIPTDAGDGDSDSVTITVSSQSDPAETAEITLTTEAIIEEYLIYLPFVSK